MTRELSIGYQPADGAPKISIEIRAPYYLFGTQATSKTFWSLPRLREIGISYLVDLGELDPIYFIGWEMMDELRREIDVLQSHLTEIEFDADTKSSWLAHLNYCHSLLVCTAPPSSIPAFVIG
jgi:hypothetical protein